MSWEPMKVTVYQDELIGEYVFYIGKLHRVVDADDFFFTIRECDVTDTDEIIEFDDGHHDRYMTAEEMEHILSRNDVVIHKIKMWTRQEEMER